MTTLVTNACVYLELNKQKGNITSAYQALDYIKQGYNCRLRQMRRRNKKQTMATTKAKCINVAIVVYRERFGANVNAKVKQLGYFSKFITKGQPHVKAEYFATTAKKITPNNGCLP